MDISQIDIPSGSYSLKDATARAEIASKIAGYAITSGTTSAYTATITGITLTQGTFIVLRFNATNVANATLNVNSLGAKPIYYKGAKITASIIPANSVIALIYDTTLISTGSWHCVYSYNANTTYSNASLGQGYGTCTTDESTAEKEVILNNYTLTVGGLVIVNFTNAVTANATMNINSKGAKSIFYKGSAITNDIIKAGDTVSFIYDGTQYQLISFDRDTSYTLATSSADGLMSSSDKSKLDDLNSQEDLDDILEEYSDTLDEIQSEIEMSHTSNNSSKTIYLSPSGDDTNNDGLSSSKPLKTFAALTRKYGYLDHIIIRLAGGTYTENPIKLYNFSSISIKGSTSSTNPTIINAHLYLEGLQKFIWENINMNETSTSPTDDAENEENNTEEENDDSYTYLINIKYCDNIIIYNSEFTGNGGVSRFVKILDSNARFFDNVYDDFNTVFYIVSNSDVIAYGNSGSDNSRIAYISNSKLNYLSSNIIELAESATEFTNSKSFIYTDSVVAIKNGGTGASTVANAKVNLGLENVENKSSATIRGELTQSDVTTALGYTPPTTNTTYSNATSSAAGLMSASDKSKLDGIDSQANKITVDSSLSSTSTNPVQNKVINTALAGKSSTSHTHTVVNGHTVESDVPSGAVFTDTTYSTMVAATSSTAGSSGLVPAPSAGNESSFLRGDGTWSIPTNLNEVALASNADLDTIITAGEYYAASGNSITNKPTGVTYFHLSVMLIGSNIYFQRLYSTSGLYIRTYTVSTTTWSDWVQDKNESNTINNFLYRDKGKERTDGTTHTAQEVLWGTDYNELTTTGLYVVRAGTSYPVTNAPDGNNTNSLFYLLTTAYSSKYVKQVALSVRDNNVIYVRTLLNGVWKSWTQISGTSSITSTRGTFTPILTPENGTDDISFSSTTGEYYIIDNCVYVNMYGLVTNNESGDFTGTITGLPFTCAGSAYHVLHISFNNTTTISNSDFIGLKCHVRGGYNYIGLRTELKSVFSSSNSNIPIRTGDTIRINGIYPISS